MFELATRAQNLLEVSESQRLCVCADKRYMGPCGWWHMLDGACINILHMIIVRSPSEKVLTLKLKI